MSDDIFDAQLAAYTGKADAVTDTPTATPSPAPVPEVPKADTVEAAAEPDAPVSSEPTPEDRARALGWNPDKDTYEQNSDGKEWVSAKTFLRMREMADEISKRGKDLKSLRHRQEQLEKQMHSGLGELKQESQQRKLSEIEQGIRQAVADQDFDRHEQLIAARDKLIKPEPVQQQDDNQAKEIGYTVDPETVAAVAEKWKQETPWFGRVAPEFRQEAHELEVRYLTMFPDATPERALRFVREEMETNHPILKSYGARLKSPDASPRATERPTPKSPSAADLSPQDRQFYEAWLRAGTRTEAQKQAFLRDTLS